MKRNQRFHLNVSARKDECTVATDEGRESVSAEIVKSPGGSSYAEETIGAMFTTITLPNVEAYREL